MQAAAVHSTNLEVPSMVPPCSWMPSTFLRVSTMGLCFLS